MNSSKSGHDFHVPRMRIGHLTRTRVDIPEERTVAPPVVLAELVTGDGNVVFCWCKITD